MPNRYLIGIDEICGRKDSMFGKLCGTLGQAHGFLYAIYQQDENYMFGKDLLKDDTDHFMPGTSD